MQITVCIELANMEAAVTWQTLKTDSCMDILGNSLIPSIDLHSLYSAE